MNEFCDMKQNPLGNPSNQREYFRYSFSGSQNLKHKLYRNAGGGKLDKNKIRRN
jgi:hypothetical protein